MKKTILFTLILLAANLASAQTQVVVESGASERLSGQLKAKVETLLNAVNGQNAYPNDSGVARLKEIVSDKNLVSTQDTLGTVVIKKGTGYELPRIFLQKKGGKAYEITELRFSFDAKLRLIDVSEADNALNIDRIISRQVGVDEAEKAKIDTLVAGYIAAFEQKDSNALSSLFSEDAVIIVGTKSRNFDGYDIVNNDVKDYLKRTTERTFVKGNDISISFENPSYFRHPDQAGVYGFSAKQNWKTTAYSDLGYLFIIMNLSDGASKIELRQWQESEFVASRFSDVSPEPWVAKAEVIDYQKTSEVSLESGQIELQTQSGDENILSASKVKDWLENGTLQFTGLTIRKASITQKESNNVEFTFDRPKVANQGQKINSSLNLKETSLMKAYSAKIEVLAGKKTVIALAAAENAELIAEIKPAESLESTVEVHLQPKASRLVVMSSDSVRVFEQAEADTLVRIPLIEGNYTVLVSKAGFISQEQNAQLVRGKVTPIYVKLAPVAAAAAVVAKIAPVQKPVDEKSSSKVGKAKWWILGAAAVLVGGGAVAYLLSGDNAEAGIPIPPGRPVGMN